MTAEISIDDVKGTREALCAAQAALNERAAAGVDTHTVPGWVAALGGLLTQLDVHRPLGPDGTHGDNHTPTCGCADPDRYIRRLVVGGPAHGRCASVRANADHLLTPDPDDTLFWLRYVRQPFTAPDGRRWVIYVYDDPGTLASIPAREVRGLLDANNLTPEAGR